MSVSRFAVSESGKTLSMSVFESLHGLLECSTFCSMGCMVLCGRFPICDGPFVESSIDGQVLVVGFSLRCLQG